MVLHCLYVYLCVINVNFDLRYLVTCSFPPKTGCTLVISTVKLTRKHSSQHIQSVMQWGESILKCFLSSIGQSDPGGDIIGSNYQQSWILIHTLTPTLTNPELTTVIHRQIQRYYNLLVCGGEALVDRDWVKSMSEWKEVDADNSRLVIPQTSIKYKLFDEFPEDRKELFRSTTTSQSGENLNEAYNLQKYLWEIWFDKTRCSHLLKEWRRFFVH